MAILPRRTPRLKSGYAKPRQSQSQSPLMQLPPEVRLIIIKNLVVADSPIRRAFYSPLTKWEYYRSYNYSTGNAQKQEAVLDTEILRTCQVLFNEAYDLLHGSNELLVKIHVKRNRWDKWFTMVPTLKEPRLVLVGRFRKDASERDIFRKFRSIRFNLNICTAQDLALGNFDKTGVMIYESIRDICINESDLLNKKISFTIYQTTRSHIRTDYDFFTRYAGAFELIRCKEISFPQLNPATYRHIAKIMTDRSMEVLNLPGKADRAIYYCPLGTTGCTALRRAAWNLDLPGLISARNTMLGNMEVERDAKKVRKIPDIDGTYLEGHS